MHWWNMKIGLRVIGIEENDMVKLK